jgi:hypothetical protein
MSNTKFTKGPWLVKQMEDVNSVYDVHYNLPASEYSVASIVLYNQDNAANADLIATAPDMYEMIEQLTSELFIAIDEVNDQRASRVTSQTENEPDYMDMQTIHEARLLLKKARGE